MTLHDNQALPLHHPWAFGAGCVAIVAGVLAHVPMLMMGRYTHYQMVGMEMDAAMLAGMALIPFGLLLSMFGLMPRFGQLRSTLQVGRPLLFHLADSARLNAAHWRLISVLVIALTVDVLKPATLGFVMPGMTAEYGISSQKAGVLALVALTGTTAGSVIWGRLADICGRRAAILLSALMFVGTAICGAMPRFEWNLVMCFLMGASAGGLLPITFTLLAETVPASHRGWLLVALGGVGTSAGYLLAASAAALLVPSYGWRALWLLGLPTGLLIVLLSRYIPKSPRYLANVGLAQQAEAVLLRFVGKSAAKQPGTNQSSPMLLTIMDVPPSERGMRTLLRGKHARITRGLLMCGTAWGLVNFGFLLWLPTNLAKMGMDASAANALLARSALLALPGILVVIWLYQRWSSLGTLVLFIGLMAAALLAFGALGWLHVRAPSAITLVTAMLLICASGVIATLVPYAAEIYPVHLRGTGSGLVAASSKLGGILGAGFGVLGLFDHFTASALLLAVPMILAAVVLHRGGIETRGRGLEEIQEHFKFSSL
jgi:putative MFS transporter